MDPVIFLVYDMTVEVNSYMTLFPDNVKLLRNLENKKDCEYLQKNIVNIHRWSKLWEMEYRLTITNPATTGP